MGLFNKMQSRWELQITILISDKTKIFFFKQGNMLHWTFFEGQTLKKNIKCFPPWLSALFTMFASKNGEMGLFRQCF